MKPLEFCLFVKYCIWLDFSGYSSLKGFFHAHCLNHQWSLHQGVNNYKKIYLDPLLLWGNYPMFIKVWIYSKMMIDQVGFQIFYLRTNIDESFIKSRTTTFSLSNWSELLTFYCFSSSEPFLCPFSKSLSGISLDGF